MENYYEFWTPYLTGWGWRVKIFDKSIKYRVEKYYGFASNNARAELLTMKQYRSSTNNSDGVFEYRSPFVLRSTSVRAPFNLRSSSVRAPFGLRSSSVQPPFEFRSTSVQPPFELRSTSVRAPFELRSTSVRAPFNLRWSSVHPPFNLRSAIEDRSKNDRRNIGESLEARRRCIETLMRN